MVLFVCLLLDDDKLKAAELNVSATNTQLIMFMGVISILHALRITDPFSLSLCFLNE